MNVFTPAHDQTLGHGDLSGFNSAEHAAFDPDHWWIAGRQAVILAVMGPRLRPGSRLLDLGCGAGLLSAELAKRYRVRSVDVSPEAVWLARQRGVDASVIGSHQELGQGYDGACAFDVMEHVDDDRELAQRLARAVRPGGLVAVAVPAYMALWSHMDVAIGHRRRYRRSGLVRVMGEAGLEPVFNTYFNSLLFPLVALSRLLGLLDNGTDVRKPSAPVNAAMSWLFRQEASLLPRMRFAAGVSVLYLGRNPG